MTAEQIATIRNMRACSVPWHVIARRLNRSVPECRAAIGMPTYDRPERLVLPWAQPDMSETSNK